MALSTAKEVGNRALSALSSLGNVVAKGGEIAAGAIGSAGKALKDSARGFESPVLQRSGEVTGKVLETVGGAMSATFAAPALSTQTSTNFQAGMALVQDAAMLTIAATSVAVTAASIAIPGLSLVGATGLGLYGALRYGPAALAHYYGRDDEQTRQGLEAGKLILGAALVGAFAPAIAGAALYAGAMTVSARNAHVLIQKG
jgi:hypothetical protein